MFGLVAALRATTGNYAESRTKRSKACRMLERSGADMLERSRSIHVQSRPAAGRVKNGTQSVITVHTSRCTHRAEPRLSRTRQPIPPHSRWRSPKAGRPLANMNALGNDQLCSSVPSRDPPVKRNTRTFACNRRGTAASGRRRVVRRHAKGVTARVQVRDQKRCCDHEHDIHGP